jgi:transaldolase
MELFLDSVDFEEIEEGTRLGVLTGLTTTPTFMHRHGITDIDGAIVKLSGTVPMLHVEALGGNYDDTIADARRILELPLKKRPVFKIPVSNYGIRACRTLIDEGHQVNIHLIYTLSQAYMAMAAGATYICPLVGRLHDQGHDAMALIGQIVNAVNKYGYQTKVMVSSVRHPEHVRQAILLGAHACTVPWNVLKRLTENTLTTTGADQFFEHTKLMTVKIRDVIRKRNPVCNLSDSIMDAIVEMTESGLGAVSIVDGEDNKLVGIFTDGDIRRQLKKEGKSIICKKMSDFQYNKPVTVNADSMLFEAVNTFKNNEFDNVIVAENNVPVGMLDIQDFVKMGLLG